MKSKEEGKRHNHHNEQPRNDIERVVVLRKHACRNGDGDDGDHS